MSCRTRGVAFGPVAFITAWVKCGLNLCSFELGTEASLEAILAVLWVGVWDKS